MVFIGSHISREKTLNDTIKKITDNNGNSLQIFVSNPRSSNITPLNPKFFLNPFLPNNFKLVIHNPYTINLASPPINNKRQMELKDCYWIKLILHELMIANSLNAIGCIVHTGKSLDKSIDFGIENMKLAISFIIDEIIKNKWNSKLIIETSSGQGTELLSNYQDFLDFYNSFNNNQKKYFKICIDTCHVWASGYELKEIFDITKNNNNLHDIYVIHANNSKNPKNSHIDRHEIINKGFIPLNDIKNFIKEIYKINHNIIIITEKPSENLNFEFNLFK
jgi:deoxyribonuclease-4